MGGLLHLVQQGGDWAELHPTRPLVTAPNVTTHPSTASVPITVLLYNGLLLCCFNVSIKGLNMLSSATQWGAHNVTSSTNSLEKQL